MANTLLAADAIDVLRQVEDGTLTVSWAPTYDDTMTSPTQEQDPIFTASNGWRICVYNNNGAWDHVEWIVTNDGRTWKASDAADATPDDARLLTYQPPATVRQTIYNWGA